MDECKPTKNNENSPETKYPVFITIVCRGQNEDKV